MASFGAEGYEYSLNNQNGMLAVDFNTVDFDETITNGLITAYEPNEFDEPNEPNEPNETEIEPPTLKKVLLNCPDNISILPVPDFNRANWRDLSLPSKDTKGSARTFTTSDNGDGVMTMGIDGVIDVNSDIISNQIWTADNTYHVVADVNIQAMLVVEPGTVVKFASSGSMSVNNGGTLISVGTPDDPVIYTSDAVEPWFSDYYCPIYIEETASTSTKVIYSYVEYAYAGIVILNKRLDTNIQNNYFYNNVYGIVEQGTEHTNICNNLIFRSYYSGIEIFLESTTSEADANSHILIENNTCDYYQDCGIAVHGVPDSNDAGWVVLANNIVSESYQYGLNLVDGYMYASVLNTGYYDNANNKNWEFEEDNPVIETIFPYKTGTGYLPVCYLDQDCNFIDTGYHLVEQTEFIGKTTDVNELPDSNYVDIGFHYPNWYFSNPGSGDSLTADLDDSMKVNFKDFAIFANYWQQSTSEEADLDGSGFVDYNDLAVLADQWLQVADPNIEIGIYGDSNEGNVNIGISGFTSDTQRVFLFIDGEYISEMFFFEDGEPLNVDISYLGPGTHQLKAVSLSNTGRITCSNIKDSTFTCFLNYHFCADAYDSNEPHYFCAYYSGSNNVSVKVYDEENNLAWSQIYSGQDLNGFVPDEVTLSDDLDYIVFEETTGTLSSGVSVTKSLGLKFDPKKVPANIRALIIVPSWWMRNFSDYGVIQAVKGTFETRNVPYCYLNGSQASYEVLAWYGANRNINYIYYCEHGGYTTDGVLRTKIKLSDGIAYSVKQSDFAPGQAPSWCEKLPGNLEKTANSMFLTGFSQGELKFVHFDCCFTGRLKITGDDRLIEGPEGSQSLVAYYHSDMSWALKMQSDETQIYQGWRGEAPKGETSKYNHFAYHEWTKLGEGDNLYNALMYAIDETDWIPDGPHDNFRLMGQGDDLTDLRVE
jgi:hypothetical protein